MVVDGADPWEAKPDGTVRPSWSNAAPVKRGWPHSCVRSAACSRPWPPSPPFAAYGRSEGGSGVRAVRGSGGGGGGGGGGFGWKRGLAPSASPVPHKRRAVYSTRRYPPVYGGEEGLRVGDSPSHGGFASEEGGLLPAELEKVVAADGGASAADWYPHGHKAMVGKASHASDGSEGLLGISGAGGFFGAWSDQLGKKHLESLPAVGRSDALVAAHDNGSLAYRQSATEIVGTMMNGDALDGEGQELEEGEIADTMEIAEGSMIKNDASSRPIEGQELEEGEIAPTMDSVEAVNKEFFDGFVEGHELEEGEIPPSGPMDIVGVMDKHTLCRSSVDSQELEEGEIASPMDTAEAMNYDTLNEVVEGQEFEDGKITTTIDILESTNTFDGVVEVLELEGGEIAATMSIAESGNKESSDGTVEVQKLEESLIAATMDIVESMNNQYLDEVVVAQELEEIKIAAMGIVEGTNKDTFIGPEEDQKLEGEIAAKGYGQEPDDGEIAAKGHGQEPGDRKLATESDHIVQQSVNVIPCGSTSGMMRSKIRLTPRKTVRPPVILDVPFSTTIATVKKFKEAQTGPVKENHTTSQPVPLHRPFFTTTATMKKFKAAKTKPVTINLASTSASASKEKRKFKYMFITEEKLKGKRVVYLENDDILKAVAVHEGKLELCLGVPSSVLSVRRHKQHGGQNADPRRRVRMMCRRFEFLCTFLAQAVKRRSMELRRIDLAADQVVKKLPYYRKRGSIVGEVAGVEVGDEFLFRVELAIVGLHSPYRAGIDTTKDTDGEPIAVSIVASGGYLDEFSSSGELVYTGSGGKAGGNDQDGDQKLQRGNLALKNCIKREIPVRVTHGFKSQNREEGSHSKGKEISKFIYDGLYHVVGCWQEGIPGSRVLKYKLRRIPGQPELPLDVAKWLRKSARS